MRGKWARLIVVIGFFAGGLACSRGQQASPAPAASPGAAAAAVLVPAASIALAQAPAPVAPQIAAIGGSPVAIPVPLPPSVNLTVARDAELQIDATASPGDVEVHVWQGDTFTVSDSDSGESTNARVVRFFTPGAYQIRLSEHRSSAINAQVSVTELAPMTPVASATPGVPVTVNTPTADNQRAASVEITLNIAAPGNYQCDAHGNNAPDGGTRDAQMMLIQGRTMLAEDGDSGDGNDARITRQLTPGAYTIRVWDWVRRATQIVVTCRPA